MEALPGRKRGMRIVRQLDHDAAGARLDAYLDEYGRLSRRAGLTAEQAIARFPRHLDPVDPSAPARASGHMKWIALLIAGLVGGLLVLAIVPEDPAPVDVVAPFPSPAAVEVAGFAELFVAISIGQAGEGTEDVLAPFMQKPPRLPGVTPGGAYVQNTATVGIEETEAGWDVVVAVVILDRIPGGYGDPSLEHHTVEVLAGDVLAAALLPVAEGGAERHRPRPGIQ